MSELQKYLNWWCEGIDETLTCMHKQKYRFSDLEFKNVLIDRSNILKALLEAQLMDFNYG